MKQDTKDTASWTRQHFEAQKIGRFRLGPWFDSEDSDDDKNQSLDDHDKLARDACMWWAAIAACVRIRSISLACWYEGRE